MATAKTPPPGGVSADDMALASDATYYDDIAQGLFAESASGVPPVAIPTQALPARQYLDATVVPLLLHGLEALVADRPQDPVEYLAAYLLSNNPQRDATLPVPPGNALLRGLVPPAPPKPPATPASPPS